ncbi:MAG: hypothetical protein IJA66_05410 [Alistipes sp.]|nr:hypothetical protein [Alistipes sp.]
MKNFKFLVAALVLSAIAPMVQAQRVNEISQPIHRWKHRQEIIIPQILGYNVYKSDLHTHTIYSDGEVTPSYRVREAWRHGLDIVAITDHIEWRGTERKLLQYMDRYIPEEYNNNSRGINVSMMHDTTHLELGILSNLNAGYEQAVETNQQFGLLIVRGAEITRGANHFNVIFTTDNNKIYHPDLETSMRNALEQGALVMHNHPTHDKTTATSFTQIAEDLHKKGLITGIEIGNSIGLRTRFIDYCIENNFAPLSNSDVHATIDEMFFTDDNEGFYRNMTLILAHERTAEAVKEALQQGRCIAYFNNRLVGREEYLAELFKQSVSVEYMCDYHKEAKVVLINKSSIPYQVKYNGKNTAVIHAMGAVQIGVPMGVSEVEFTVTNLLCGNNKHPKVMMPVERK